VIATCGAGGADLQPRHFEIDLDQFEPPVVSFVREGHEFSSNPAFSLASGEVERFRIWAYAKGQDLLTWTLEIPVIVNGKRLTLPVEGPTDLHFQTLGQASGVGEHLRSGDDWLDRDPR
jgi:hypothetical protein